MESSDRRFERLLRPVLADLYRFARRLARGDADDLLQASLERGLVRVDQLASDGAFRVWLSRVIYTTWVNDHAKRREQPVGDVEGAGEPMVAALPRPDERAMARQTGRALQDALDALPDDQRAAVWLVDAQGHTFAEAAHILQVAPGTVASRVGRGRKSLRGELEPLRMLNGGRS